MVQATFGLALAAVVLGAVGVALLIVQARRSDSRQLEGSLRAELKAGRSELITDLRLINDDLKDGVQSTRTSLDQIRDTVDARLDEARVTAERNINSVRDVVDGRLHATLETLSRSVAGVLSDVRSSQRDHAEGVLQQLEA